MKSIIRACIFAIAVSVTGAGPGLAQQGGSPQSQLNEELLSWMRLAETDRRCTTLLFFELRAIEHNIAARLRRTQTSRDAQAMAGGPNFDDALAAHQAFAEQMRAQARAETADTPCSVSENPIFMQARQLYMRDLLRLSIIENRAGQRYDAPFGYVDAFNQLNGFLGQLYGDNTDSVASQIVEELNAVGPEALVGNWEAFKPFLTDVIWVIGLGENRFQMAQHRTETGWHQFFRDGEPAADFGLMGRPQLVQVRGSDQAPSIPWLQAQGRMADDRIMIAYVFANTPRGSDDDTPVRAQIYTHEEPGTQNFRADDLRETGRVFEGEVMADEDCPAHVCFVFPMEMTELVKQRQAAGAAFGYELYVGLETAFPAPPAGDTLDRKQIYMPLFSE